MNNFNLFKTLAEHSSSSNIIHTTEALRFSDTYGVKSEDYDGKTDANYDVNCDETDDKSRVRTLSPCVHGTLIYENGSAMCNDCGIELHINPNNKESVYYSIAKEKKSYMDPTRCYIRKLKDKTIYQDVQHLNISDHIKDVANNIYIQCSGEKVKRGCNRRGIVFASIFHAYKLDRNPQSCESLIALFNIERKDALKGLKFINENAPNNASLRTTYITPEHLIIEFVSKFQTTPEQQREIIELYRKIKGRSAMLNRSRPQSVSSGIIYYWLMVAKRNISLKEFIKKVGLSELTVSKIAKEVARILDTPDVL
jgi:transcription initiation factor TFIIIB Brf1 subunit/transcription initiation factor TFIIB